MSIHISPLKRHIPVMMAIPPIRNKTIRIRIAFALFAPGVNFCISHSVVRGEATILHSGGRAANAIRFIFLR
ncbi:hypothetical protein UUU_20320 [Klebsiella pneumoniae subsp. pneumoniae DSM 30104 = JCM 1662 = NBRC 14940]|nr:hypothetical protein UUU_20320 [Klebsiella pneumoniae subsp. pneumoniae DSM 30104 = JCM 1662 = NBRC 14940]